MRFKSPAIAPPASAEKTAPNTSESSRDKIANTSPSDSGADVSVPPIVASSADVPSAGTSSQALSASATSSAYPVSTPWIKNRDRDKFGRFKESSGDRQKTKDDAQKQRDKTCANVSKWKSNIVYNIRKIQAVRPDVSQTYLFESDIKKTRTNPVVYQTKGTSRVPPSTRIDARVPLETGAEDKGADDLDTVNTEGYDDIEPPEISVDSQSQGLARTVNNRICDKLCYVCHTKVGPDSSKRIGNYKIIDPPETDVIMTFLIRIAYLST